MEDFSIILFHSTNYAIWAAKVLKKMDIKNKMTPIPRHLSSDCGYCVKIFTSDADRAHELLKTNGIEFDRIEKLGS